MKFLTLAVAAVLGMAEGKRTLSAAELKSRMAKGQFNKETLMRGAKPYGETARRLEQAQQQEEQEWEINGLYSVQFSSCVSLTVSDDDIFNNENMLAYAQEGFVKAEKSYILFTACQSADCYYQSNDQKLTFITDIASFFQAFSDFLPNQVENYCEGCNRNYDYCMGNLDAADEEAEADANADANANQAEAAEEEAAAEEGAAEGEQQQNAEGQQGQEGQQDQAAQEGGEQQAAEGENGNARRKLSKILDFPARQLNNNKNNKVIQMIDCDMCTAYECFEDAEAEAQQEANGEVVWDFDDALAWLDGLSECQQMEQAYNDMALYAGVICNAEGTGIEIGVFMDQDCTLYAPKLSYSSMMTEADTQYFAMTEEIVEYMFTTDFSCYQPDIEYTNPYEYQQNDEQAADENQAQEDPEAAEWCNNLFNGNMEATNLANCGAEDNGNDNQAEDENLANYDWYTYQISGDQANNAAQVCQVLYGMNGKYTTLYDKSNGGTLYTYKKTNANKNGMRPGGVATLVIFIVLAAAAAAAFIVKKKKTNDKKTPLISATDGTGTLA